MALRQVTEGERKSIYLLAKEKWHGSGLSDATAKRLGLQALSAMQTQALGPNFLAAGSLRIPYFDLKGNKTKFFRIRYLEKLPGFEGQVESPQRYAQEIHTLNEVYLAPLLDQTWEEIADDAEQGILITEGELKAASACAVGVATIGLGGVDVWRSSKRGIDFLPALARIVWKERDVTVVFDSDLTLKPQVIRAQRTLAKELAARGSQVKIASLPPGKGGAKVGLDDFLVALGDEGLGALEELIEESPALPESDALWGLNEEVIFARHPGVVIERASGEWMEPNKFAKTIYANRHFMETTFKKGIPSLVKKQLAPKWIEWEHRAEVLGCVYEPGHPREYQGKWNLWPGWGCTPKYGSVEPWTWLLDHLFGDQVKIRAWFERWCGYPIKHPGTKLFTASVLWSREQRVGKTSVATALSGIYGRNFVEIKSRDLKGNFNSWAKNRQFISEDEITGGDAKVDADWLKGMITQINIMIKEKFIPDYVVRDCMNHYFTSNHPDALFVDDKDGRYMIHEVRSGRAEKAKYEWFNDWLAHDGSSFLFRHFLDLNYSGFSPYEAAPMTPGKLAMANLGRNEASTWVQFLLENPLQALAPLGPTMGIDRLKECDLFTPSQLLKCYLADGTRRGSVVAIGRALAVAGYRQLNFGTPISTCLGLQRIYALRHQIEWEQSTKKEIREHFNKYHGPEGARKL